MPDNRFPAERECEPDSASPNDVMTKPSPVPRRAEDDSAGDARPAAGLASDPPPAAGSTAATSPAADRAGRLVARTRWVPWSLGAVVVVVAAFVVAGFAEDDSPQGVPTDLDLSRSTHTVVYEVTGTGKSPEIRFVSDGIATTKIVDDATLPWREKVSVEVGPGPGIAQIMAANTGKDPDGISCSISVDGTVVHQATSRGVFSGVSCSAVIRPASG